MKKKLIAGAAGLAMASGVGLGMTQLAQAETPTPTPTTSTPASPTPGDSTTPSDSTTPTVGHDGHGHRGGGVDVAALATKLGLDEATVSDALLAVRDQLDTTRPAREATQAERDAARTAQQSALAKALAGELKVDEATVTEALDEIRAGREAARAAEEKSTLDQAVTDGTLTRTEADAVQKAIDAGIVSARGGDHREGGHGHR